MKRETKILDIDSRDIDARLLGIAAAVITGGGVVVFPTETVYGIGADALNDEAVKKIFKAKGRPSDNPLIVHISDMEMLDKIAVDIPLEASLLAKEFWPGPLTLVLKKSPLIPKTVTAGLDTIAVRLPRDPIARALIRAAGTPVCAPSANISGRPSSTAFDHVFDDLDGKVDVIIRSCDSEIGLESTVLDLTGSKPVILRPGAVTSEQLAKSLGVEVVEDLELQENDVPRSPGMKYKHYAPRATIFLFSGEAVTVRDHILRQACKLSAKHKIGILSFKPEKAYEGYFCISLTREGDLEEASQNLFRTLRQFDREGVDVILAEAVPQTGIGVAIMNRLKRACNNKIKYL